MWEPFWYGRISLVFGERFLNYEMMNVGLLSFLLHIHCSGGRSCFLALDLNIVPSDMITPVSLSLKSCGRELKSHS